MANKEIGKKGMYVKPTLTQHRKVGGKVYEEEIAEPHFSDDDIGGLLDGVTGDEIEAGRERIARENPEYAAQAGHDMILNADANVVHTASTGGSAGSKRFGSLMDRETQDVIDFRRLVNGSVQLTSPETGEVLDTLSSADFDAVITSGSFNVL